MENLDQVREKLLASFSIDSSYKYLPVSSRQEIDAALHINGEVDRVTPEILRSMKDPRDFGSWLVGVAEMNEAITPQVMYETVAKVLVAASTGITGKKYLQSVASAFGELKKRWYSTNAFADVFLEQALGRQRGAILKPLLSPVPPSKYGDRAATESDAAQEILLAAFQRRGGLKEFLIEHFSQKLIGRLVVEHGLSGMQGIISRKDRGSLLSIELGL